MAINNEIFKAYDIRGLYPAQIDENAVYKIVQAYIKTFKPSRAIVLGKDVRISSPSLWQSAAKGITDAGCDVIDIETISTDMLYFAVAYYDYGGGITISASHNPKEYNGMKIVRENSVAVSADTGLAEIKKEAAKDEQIIEPEKGEIIKKDILDDYVKHCCSFIDTSKIKPIKLVANANFGMAGVVLKKMLANLPIEIIPLNFEPNGNFPKGRPDPSLPENRQEIEELVKSSGANLGVAWDADADRCFIFDENGQVIDGYFLTSILAEYFLQKNPGEKIISDPRLVWAVKDTVLANNGIYLVNKPGHAFIKDRLRSEDAIFAGETSGHFYFRDNFYCDNGMIPLLIVLEILGRKNIKVSELARPYREKYFISGEINKTVKDSDKVIKNIEKKYKDGRLEYIDGFSFESSDWRFNLRKSNTEPLIRLNIEAKSQVLINKKIKELLALIK